MVRPIKEVDEKLIENLAAINCSMEEIGSLVDLDRSTLQRRYAAVIEKGRFRGKTSLKKKMFDTAMGGNITMMIWLSKQMLGYSDKQEIVRDERDPDKEFLRKIPTDKIIKLIEDKSVS